MILSTMMIPKNRIVRNKQLYCGFCLLNGGTKTGLWATLQKRLRKEGVFVCVKVDIAQNMLYNKHWCKAKSFTMNAL